MSFAVDLWDKFDFLVKKSNEGRSRLEEFSSIIQQRADLEDYYSKIIEKIGLTLTNFIERGLKNFFFLKKKKNIDENFCFFPKNCFFSLRRLKI